MPALKVGYIPEHFSTPLQFAQTYKFFELRGLDVELVPFPSGSGHLIQCLNNEEIDIAVGLTEAFITSIGNGNKTLKIQGTYVKSPLCWAISSGIDSDIKSLKQLDGAKIGVSRIGSGSYVMSFVLAIEQSFEKANEFEVLTNFKNLRDAVNSGKADAFMWEHFTSKKYYDAKEIRKIGEIYTPWPSWVIVSSSKLDQGVADKFLDAVQEGIEYFNDHKEEAVEWIYTNLDYTKEDAQSWLKTVQFADDCHKIDWQTVVEKTHNVLRKAGVLKDSEQVVDQRLAKFVKN